MSYKLFLLRPTVIFRARLNSPASPHPPGPYGALSYDTVTFGSTAAVREGQTLLLGTASGLDDLGRQRVLHINSFTIYIGQAPYGVEDGEIKIDDNAHITILDDYRVWAKVPYQALSIESHLKDGVFAVSGYAGLPNGGAADRPPPVANGGSGFAATVDGAGKITVTFSATASFAFPLNASTAMGAPTSYLWSVGDGTITAGTATSSTITATFPRGFRWVHLRVTDSFGITHTTHIPVVADDPDFDISISEFQIVSHRMSVSGTEMSVRVLADIPRDEVPDGTLAIVWEGEPLGPTDRSNIRFAGWHQSDDTQLVAEPTATLMDTTLNLVDVAGRLKTLPAFSQVLEYVAGTIQTWMQTHHNTILNYIHYLLHWHSTALEVADLLVENSRLYGMTFTRLESSEGDLYSQTNDLAVRLTPDHYLTCNQFGQMALRMDRQIADALERPADNMGFIEIDEWNQIRYSYNRSPKVHQMLTYAVTPAGTPLAATAPDVIYARGQGLQYIETSSRYAQIQHHLNVCEGNRYARLNARYGMLTITLPYELLPAGAHPASMKWLLLEVLTTQEPPRGLVLLNNRGMCHEITIDYQYERTGLVRTATVTWEPEVFGEPAVAYSEWWND